MKESKRILLLEIVAIIFGLLYTILYIKEIKICFLFAILGAGIYAYLCFKKQIFAEAILQLFYIPMAIYGWVHWGEYGSNSYTLVQHITLLIVTILIMIGLAYYLKRNTNSKSPILDSFTTSFAFAGTWLMVNFIHEMWLYFFAVNFISIFLYYGRGMKLSVILYAFYTYVSLAMWFGWELFF